MSAVGRKLTLNLNKLRKKLTDVPADASQADQQEHYLHVPAGGPGDGNTGEGSQRSASLSSSPVQKSHSMCSINREEREAIGQDDIMKLTQEVKCFSDALALLKSLFTEPQESSEEVRVLAHERLGEVLNLLKTVLQSYQALNSTDVFSASGTLITKIKNYSYEREDAEEQRQLCDAIDHLALAFSSSVSEYLMGETVEDDETDVKTKSCDNLASVPGEMTEGEFKQGHLSADDVNLILVELEAGVDLALQRAKAWSKYAKDVISYIDRKSQFESEYAKNLTRLAQSMKQPLTEEGFLPLQSVYCTAMSQDIEYASTSQATCNLLQNQKFVEPMALRRAEHDKVRKFLKDIWSKEMKKMHDAVTNLKKAKSMYIQRHQEFDKARELAQKTEADMLNQSGGAALSKVDKRKRLEEDALHRAAEAETTYKACVAEANIRQDELAKVKGVVLTKLQEQIRLSDETMKRVTMDYFQLQIAVSAPVPVQHQTLCETSHDYEPGSQYAEFVRRIPVSAQRVQHEPFTFQPYQPEKQHGHRKPSNQSNGSGGSDHASQENSPQSAQRRHFKDRAAPFQAWAQGGLIPGSDTDSASSYRSGENPSPRSSPRSRAGRHYEHGDEDIEDHLNDSGLGHSVETLIGQGRKTVPGRVRDSDYHTVCSRLGGRRNTFGVDFGEQVKKTNTQVPPIVTLCLQEIENRGLDIRGIYRVSGVKSKVETLCQKFDNNPEGVDLGEENPNVISNVLKLYLRQLPEPLLSFRLYPEFIRVAKEDMSGNVDSATTVERLTALVQRLPKSNFKTSAILMHHLKKLASNVEFNQMSCNNLGIVFGPTLLRPKEGTASLTSLVDTPHQTRTVELLIVNAEEVFGPAADYQVTDIQPGNVSPDRLPSEDGSIDDNLDETPARSPVASGIESVFSEEPSPVDKESGHEFSLPGSASVGNHLSLSSDSEVTSDGGRVIPVQRVSTVSGAVRPSDPGSGGRRLDVQRESTPPADSSHSVNIIIPIDSVQALREKMKRDLGVAPSPPPTDHPSVERPPLKSPSASAKMAFFYGDPEHSNSGKSWGSQFPEQKLSPRDSLRTSHSASQLVADKEAGADHPPRVTSLPADLTRGPGRPTGSRLSMPVPKPYTSTLVHPVEMRGDKPPVTTTTTSECAADNSAVQQAVVKGIVGGNATTTTAASTSQVNSDKQPVELTKAARLPTAKTSSYGFSGDGSNPVQLRRTPRPVLTTSYSLPLPGTGVRPGDVKAADRQGIPLPYSRPTELRENSKPASLTSSHNAQISGTGPISGTKPPVTTIAKFKLGEPAESADSDKDSVTSSAMAGTTVGVSAVPSAQPLCEDKIEYKIPVRYVVSDSRDSPPVEQVQKSESETIVIQPVKMSPRELETKYV